MILLRFNTGIMAALVLLSWFVLWTSPGLYGVLLSVGLLLALVLAIWSFLRANLKTLARVSAGDKTKALLQTLAAYPLLLATLGLGFWLQAEVSYDFRWQLYEYRLVERAPDVNEPIGYWRGGRSLEKDIRHTINLDLDRARDAAKAEFNAAVDTARKVTENERKRIPLMVGAAFDRNLIDGRCPRGTGWICSRINRAYRSSVAEQNRKLKNSLDTIAANVAEQGESARKPALDQIDATRAEAGRQASGMMDLAVSVTRITSLSAVLFLFAAILKSFFYLYFRILMTRSRLQSSFCDDERRSTGVDVIIPRSSHKISLTVESGTCFYVSTGLNFLGDIERKAVPLPLSAVGTRLLNRLYILHQVQSSTSQNAKVILESSISDHFVRIDLNDREEFFFSMRYLAAFSNGISFRKYLNPRIMGLIFGKLTYISAKGPGTIVLLVPGGLTISEEDQEFLQHRLVAWKSTTKFKVRSSMALGDLYFSGLSVSSAVPGTCIIENATSLRHRRYISRFFRRFLWPL